MERLEAIAAIEARHFGIGRLDGSLLYCDKEDKKNFFDLTYGKQLIVGRKTFETLPDSVFDKGDRKVHLVTSENLKDTRIKLALGYFSRQPILIGGAMTYEYFSDLVTKWMITWFHAEDEENLVRFKPNLADFYITHYEKGVTHYERHFHGYYI